jgi:ribosome-binding protein aMBF1 (putative translation factor)
MITNDRQCEITRQWLAKFQESLDEVLRLLNEEPEDRNERRKLETFAASYRSQVADLQGQLDEYDALRTQKPKTLPVASVEDLPKALIRARITAGVLQSEIAQRLGLDEDRFIREEGNDYASLSVAQLREIAALLGVKLIGDVQLPPEGRRSAA